MKKLLMCVVAFCLLFANITVNAAQRKLIHSEPLDDIRSNYECSFEVKLDSSFKNTWIYDISDDGNLSVKLESIRTMGYGPILATFSGKTTKQYTDSGHQGTFSKGVYDFHPTLVVENGKWNTYGSEDSPRFRMILEKDDGVTKITMYLHNYKYNNETVIEDENGNETVIVKTDNAVGGIRKESSAISYIPGSFKEKGRADSIFNINGANDEYNGISPNDNEIDNMKNNDKDTKPADKEDDDEEMNPKDDLDSIAAQLEQYSKYEKDGTTYAVSMLKGNFQNGKMDYRIDITARFNIEDKKSDIAKSVLTDGNLTLSYYNVVRTRDGKDWREIQLLKIEGDKGELWFESGDVEIRPADPAVEINPDAHLTDDSSIYMAFVPITFIDDSILPDATAIQKVVGVKNALSFTFQYNNESKTHMEAVQVRIGSTTSDVTLDEIDYTGGFISYFLKSVYPDTWQDVAKEIGVTI